MMEKRLTDAGEMVESQYTASSLIQFRLVPRLLYPAITGKDIHCEDN